MDTFRISLIFSVLLIATNGQQIIQPQFVQQQTPIMQPEFQQMPPQQFSQQQLSQQLGLFTKYFNVFTIPSYVPQPPSQMTDFFKQLYLPNLTHVAQNCHPKSLYASFNPNHRSAVQELVDLYNGWSKPRSFEGNYGNNKSDLESQLQFSEFVKSRPEVHPNVWYASFLRAQARNSPNNLAGFHRPSAIDLFPTTFFPDFILKQSIDSQASAAPRAVGAANRFKRQQQQQCLIVDERVGVDNGAENALWYLREDIMLNAHHFIWHMLFPTSSRRQIQRRGELFYFFHHDLLARYTTERLSLGLQPLLGQGPIPLYVQPNSVIDEGYNAHLTDGVSSEIWAPRPSQQPLTVNTLSRDIYQSLQGVSTNRQRIIDILNTGNINVNGRSVSIQSGGIDNINIFGELSEASVFSINPNYYGQPGIHNDAHWIIANVINNFPPGSLGVMGHSATAMRDPVFYRVHRGIDNIFVLYKNTFLQPYALSSGPYQLLFPDIRVSSPLSVISDNKQSPLNNLGTFWNLKRFNLQGGLDFNPSSETQSPNINICAKHLDHEEFSYSFQVENSRGSVSNAMVRIFLAPRFKSLTTQERYTYEEQRGLFFSLDSFVQTIQPGTNTIVRRSLDSTLTAPWPRSIEQIRQDINSGRLSNVHCECGFPHHLLLPRGTEQGMVFDLFVMLTDASVDVPREAVNNAGSTQCVPSHIHCGLIGQNYPDNKPMGYPFERRVVFQQGGSAPSNIEEFTRNVPNAAVGQIIITHRNIQVGT